MAFAGRYAAFAPEAILALPVARGSHAARTQQHAAIVAASPVFWLRLLAARGTLWETKSAWEVPEGEVLRALPAAERSPIRRVRRITGATPSGAPEELPENVRAALTSVAAETDMRLTTMMHIGYWAWRFGTPRAVDDAPPVAGEPERDLLWRQEGWRLKRHLPETITAMRFRWAKRAGLIDAYYLELGTDVLQAAVTLRIRRVERHIPAALCPDPQDPTHNSALTAMLARIRAGWLHGKSSR